MSVGHCKYKRIRLHDIKTTRHEKYILIYLVRVVVLLLPLIVNGSGSTSFETIRNTLYKTQLPKVLHSVFRVSYFFFYLLRVLYNGFPEKASVFFRQMKKNFDSAKQREKQGCFQKKDFR